MTSAAERLSSWLVVNGRYDSRAVNPPENDPGGHQRVHWEDLLRRLKAYGAQSVETMVEIDAALDGSKEVVVIQGHSRCLKDAPGVALDRVDGKRINPVDFPRLDGCRLLWLSTCFGERWLRHGLWEMMPVGAVVVTTSAESDSMYGSGDAGLDDLARQWLDAIELPWGNEELWKRVTSAFDRISQHEPQNLRVLKKASSEQSLADAWNVLRTH